jgi:Rrf2 family protein
MILRKEGFVMSTRGQSGGYTLSREAKDINVGEVLTALGGKLYDAEFCRKHSGTLDICTHAVDCSVRSLWQVIQHSVDDVLGKLSLADMLGSAIQAQNVTLFEAPQRPLAVK